MATSCEASTLVRKQFADFVLSQKGFGHRNEFHAGSGKDSRFLGEDHFFSEALRQAELEAIKSQFE